MSLLTVLIVGLVVGSGGVRVAQHRPARDTIVPCHTPDGRIMEGCEELTWSMPGPTLIPTDDFFCPEQAVLQERYVKGKRLYACTDQHGQRLWAVWWCGPVPTPTAQVTAPLCVPDTVGWDHAMQGFPRFHCQPGLLRWHLQCRTLGGHLLWEVPLED